MELFKLFGTIAVNNTEAMSAIDETTNKAKSFSETMSDKFTSFGKSATKLGTKMSLGLTTPITIFGKKAIQATADFEYAMSEVAAISGATGDDLAALTNKAKEMGEKTKFSASESAEALKYMAMAGWKTNDMLDGLEGIMNLAAASGEDLGTTSDIVTDALTAFGLTASDSGHFADILATAASNANTNVSMMGETFKYCAPVAGALGFSAEDTAEAIGLMANAGIKSSQAGTSLRTIMNQLSSDIEISGEKIGDVTIATTNADGSMRNLKDILADCRVAFNGLSESEQTANAKAIFGMEAMSGFLSLMNAAPADIEKLEGAISSCDGVTQQMADTMNDNLTGQITLLKSQLEGLAIQFTDLIMPYLRQGVEWLSKLCDWIAGLDDGSKKMMIGMTGILAAAGPLLIFLGKISTGIGSIIKVGSSLISGISGVSGSLSGIGAVLSGLSAPVLAVIAVIGTLVAAFINLWNTNEEFRNNIIGIWDGIKDKFNEFGQGIVDRLNALGFDFESFTEAISALWNGFCELLAPVFEGVFNQVSVIIGSVLDAVMGILDIFIGLFTGNWEQCWNGVKEVFGAVWELIKGTFESWAMAFQGIADTVLGWFGTSWEECWTGAKDFFAGIWDGIKEAFASAGDGLKNIWDNIVNAVSSAWETIQNVVQVGIMFLGELIQLGFDIITIPFRFIWENCKEYIIAAWDFIKEKVESVLNTISEIITNVWNAISGFLGPILEGIKNVVISAWEAIKEHVSTKLNEIKNHVTNIWNAVSGFLKTILEAIKNIFTTVFNNIKNTVTNVFNGIKGVIYTAINYVKNNISTGLNAAKTIVTNILNAIKDKFTESFEKVKNTVKNGIDKVKSFFNFSWSLPHLKLPHFSVSGSFSLNPPSVPSFGIEWYKKGGIMTDPTAFGFNPFSGKTMVGGEAGDEAVAPIDLLLGYIRQAVAEQNNTMVTILTKILDKLDEFKPNDDGDIIIPIYFGNELWDEIIIKSKSNITLRSGGMVNA